MTFDAGRKALAASVDAEDDFRAVDVLCRWDNRLTQFGSYQLSEMNVGNRGQGDLGPADLRIGAAAPHGPSSGRDAGSGQAQTAQRFWFQPDAAQCADERCARLGRRAAVSTYDAGSRTWRASTFARASLAASIRASW
jgi:hypothetical protein